jgi:hypothetical protein
LYRYNNVDQPICKVCKVNVSSESGLFFVMYCFCCAFDDDIFVLCKFFFFFKKKIGWIAHQSKQSHKQVYIYEKYYVIVLFISYFYYNSTTDVGKVEADASRATNGQQTKAKRRENG